MALTRLGGVKKYIKAKELEKGWKLTGVFMGSEVDPTYKQLQHKFATKAGTVIINGCKSLNDSMEQAKKGMYCEVEYLGVEKVKKGPRAGKDFHVFAVDADMESIGKEQVVETDHHDNDFDDTQSVDDNVPF